MIYISEIILDRQIEIERQFDNVDTAKVHILRCKHGQKVLITDIRCDSQEETNYLWRYM